MYGTLVKLIGLYLTGIAEIYITLIDYNQSSIGAIAVGAKYVGTVNIS